MNYRPQRKYAAAFVLMLVLGLTGPVAGQITVSYIGPPDDLAAFTARVDAVVRVKVGDGDTREVV